MGRASVTTKRLREDAENVAGGEVIQSTITTGVRSGFNRRLHSLIPFFRKAADSVGIYTWVVGLYANDYVLRCLDQQLPVQLSTSSSASAWKTFYDQIWSAFDGKTNQHDVRAFLRRYNGALHGASEQEKQEAKWVLPAPVPFQMRDNASAELQRATTLHIKGDSSFIWKRTRVHMLNRFAEEQIRRRGIIHEGTRCVGYALVQLLKELRPSHTVAVPLDLATVHVCKATPLSASTLKSVKDLQDLLESDQELVDLAIEIAYEEKQLLGDSDFGSRLVDMFPHARRYSCWAEDWCVAYHFHSGDAEETKQRKKRILQAWDAANVKLPKAFSLLPLPSCKRRIVQYEGTALATFMLQWVSSIAEEARDSLCAPHSLATYKYEDLTDEVAHLQGVYREGRRLKQSSGNSTGIQKEILQSELHSHRCAEAALFDLLLTRSAFGGSSEKGWRKGWVPIRLSTDGVRLAVTFASGVAKKAPNIDGLSAANYKWDAPAERLQLEDTDRGVYRDHQWRHDISCQAEADVKLIAIDPGIKKKLQIASAPLSLCSNAAKLAELAAGEPKSVFWQISSDEWADYAGTRSREARVVGARQRNRPYDVLVEELRMCRKRTSNSETFQDYLFHLLGGFSTFTSHLLHPQRSMDRWRDTRKAMSALARIADRVWGIKKRKKGEPHLPKNEKKRTIVLIGDGSFGDTFPKKKFVRALASRGLTIVLDEYNTSSMCPCGESKLQDTSAIFQVASDDAPRRPRCHKAAEHEGPCHVMSTFLLNQLDTDRDELACMQMLLAAHKGLCYGTRPKCLCSGVWRKGRL